MLYDLLKVAHVVAVFALITGVAVLGVALLTPGNMGASLARRYDRMVGVPGLALTWILGMTLAVMSGSLATGWMGVKLLAVVALSALHGMLSGRLRRRLRGGDDAAQPAARSLMIAALACVVVIVSMVIIKPF